MTHRQEINQAVENEIRAIRRLCEPSRNQNIVTVLRHGEVRDAAFYYIDMELCDENLEEYMRRHTSSGAAMTKLQICVIMRQIANGVAFIHENRLVHRDIKPRNGNIAFVLYESDD
jgi:serine/threonine protein kinase